MKLAKGNMFHHPADLILVTTNSTVRSNGTLVMGRGAAREMRHYFPKAEQVFGGMVQSYSSGPTNARRYGVLLAPKLTVTRYGIFQVKYHWGKPAVPELISYSVTQLNQISYLYPRISLNFPAIGNGGLSREVVLPLIEGLAGNVTVWEL